MYAVSARLGFFGSFRAGGWRRLRPLGSAPADPHVAAAEPSAASKPPTYIASGSPVAPTPSIPAGSSDAFFHSEWGAVVAEGKPQAEHLETVRALLGGGAVLPAGVSAARFPTLLGVSGLAEAPVEAAPPRRVTPALKPPGAG